MSFWRKKSVACSSMWRFDQVSSLPHPNWTSALAAFSQGRLCQYRMILPFLHSSPRVHWHSVLLCHRGVSYSDNTAHWNGHQWVNFLTAGSWWRSIHKAAKPSRSSRHHNSEPSVTAPKPEETSAPPWSQMMLAIDHTCSLLTDACMLVTYWQKIHTRWPLSFYSQLCRVLLLVFWLRIEHIL